MPALSCEILLNGVISVCADCGTCPLWQETLTRMLRGVVGLPSLSSSCGSSASMASMVAEGGGGGEQVTPDKAMQMQNAASLQGCSGWRQARMRIHTFAGNAAKLRGVRHALVRREWALIQTRGWSMERDWQRHWDGKSNRLECFILGKRGESPTSSLKRNI